jgi:hypothetical protein
MTLEALYYISQIVASVAVLASLIYLALQTRQAARSSRAVMHENRSATILRHIDKITEAEFHPIWTKGILAAADMSDAEIARFMQQAAGWVIVWEERYREFQEGMLDEKRWAASVHTISRMTTLPGFRAVIATMRPRLDPDFRAMLDKHLAIGRAAPPFNAAAAWRAAAAEELAALERLKDEQPHP